MAGRVRNSRDVIRQNLSAPLRFRSYLLLDSLCFVRLHLSLFIAWCKLGHEPRRTTHHHHSRVRRRRRSAAPATHSTTREERLLLKSLPRCGKSTRSVQPTSLCSLLTALLRLVELIPASFSDPAPCRLSSRWLQLTLFRIPLRSYAFLFPRAKPTTA